MNLLIRFFLAFCWVVAIIILMIEPVQWLINTWFDPSYNSQGLFIAGLLFVLLIWSVSSPRIREKNPSRSIDKALLLFITMAMIRLSGQFLGINMLSALALVIDVYALGLLLAVQQRKHPLSPAWCAILFAFSLPIERIIQRVLGFPLQLISANGSCSLLSLFNDSIQCHGVEMILNQQAVLVDLPCSGTRGLMQLFILFTLISCIQRPAAQQSAIKYLFSGVTLVIISAYLSNLVRISILALGIAYPDSFFGINVMASPWHDLIGLFTLTLSTLPLLLWSYHWSRQNRINKLSIQKPCVPVVQLPGEKQLRFISVISPVVVIIAILITFVPTHPLDVVKISQVLPIPQYLNGYYARQQAITAQEQHYFTQYGGHAHKVSYGNFALLQVTTRAPLRHLHAPDECLTGSGHQVQYLGYSQTPLNSAIYKSIDPQGRNWRISVTFISSRGQLSTNIAEAIWLWLQQPESHWTMLQRITPWDTPQEELTRWDKTLIQVLELNG